MVALAISPASFEACLSFGMPEQTNSSKDISKPRQFKIILPWTYMNLYVQKDSHNLMPEEVFESPFVLDFIEAIQNNDLKKMERLEKEGVDINSRGKYGITPLICALRSNEQTFHWLLDKGANPNEGHWSKNGEVPILYTAIKFWQDYPDIFYIRLLLEHKARVDIPLIASSDDSIKYYPLNWLFDRDCYCMTTVWDTQALELLVKAGADINPPDFNFLFQCTTYAQVLYLLESGADEKRVSNELYPKESFIDVFVRNHTTMAGFTKQSYTQFIDKYAANGICRYPKKEAREMVLAQWDNYWKIVELLRKKGYDLKTETESIKMKREAKVPVILTEYYISY